jgi:hypothetical protein
VLGAIADRGHRRARGHQAVEQVAGDDEVGDDQSVGAFAVRRGLRQEAAQRVNAVHLVEDQVVTPPGEGGLDAGDDLPEVPPVEQRHRHPDGVRPTGGEAGGVGIRLVTESNRGFGDARPGAGGDVRQPAQRPADRRHRDAGGGGDAADRGIAAHLLSTPGHRPPFGVVLRYTGGG